MLVLLFDWMQIYRTVSKIVKKTGKKAGEISSKTILLNHNSNENVLFAQALISRLGPSLIKFENAGQKAAFTF